MRLRLSGRRQAGPRPSPRSFSPVLNSGERMADGGWRMAGAYRRRTGQKPSRPPPFAFAYVRDLTSAARSFISLTHHFSLISRRRILHPLRHHLCFCESLLGTSSATSYPFDFTSSALASHLAVCDFHNMISNRPCHHFFTPHILMTLVQRCCHWNIPSPSATYLYFLIPP